MLFLSNRPKQTKQHVLVRKVQKYLMTVINLKHWICDFKKLCKNLCKNILFNNAGILNLTTTLSAYDFYFYILQLTTPIIFTWHGLKHQELRCVYSLNACSPLMSLLSLPFLSFSVQLNKGSLSPAQTFLIKSLILLHLPQEGAIRNIPI